MRTLARARRHPKARQKDSPSSRHSNPSRVLLSPLLCAAIVLVGGISSCQGCGHAIGEDAAKAIAEPIKDLVAQLPDLLKELDSTALKAIGQADAAVAHNIQEVSRALREQIDGINGLVQDTIDNVDAMLAARIQQVFLETKKFIKELNEFIKGVIPTVTYNVQTLIKQLEVSGTEVLDAAGFHVVKILKEGNRSVALVVGGTVETVVLVIAALVLVLTLLLGGIFVMRMLSAPKSVQQWVPGIVFFTLMLIFSCLVLFLPSARASVAVGRVPLSSEDAICPQTLPEAGLFVANNGSQGSLTEEKKAEAIGLLGRVLSCENAATTSNQRDLARQLESTLERLLGLSFYCRQNQQCNAAKGEHCEVTTGLCTDRCTTSQACGDPGLVCHVAIGVCGPPCTKEEDCRDAALRCGSEGLCEPKGGTPATPPDVTPAPPDNNFRIPPGILVDRYLPKTLPRPGPCLSCSIAVEIPIEPAHPDLTPPAAEVKVNGLYINPALETKVVSSNVKIKAIARVQRADGP